MKYHSNAALTVHLRRRLHDEFHQGASLKYLADKYHVSTNTVQKWAHRDEFTDRSSAPRRRRSKRPPGLKKAVLKTKEKNQKLGSLGIAQRLQKYYPDLTRSRVRHILKAQEKIGKKKPKTHRERKHLPVGRNRVQMDIQQIPALKGGSGFEYKISIIHMRTRLKYSEIHPDHRSATVAGVLIRAIDHLPPIRLVWTDNAMEFTMRYTAHPERNTAFQKCVMALDMIHGTCKSRSPWQNGIIERSHRTDNEELFDIMHFIDSEDCRYQLRLFEMYYSHERPHQGLNGLTPFQVYLRDYPLHATTRMLGTPSPTISVFQGTT